MVARDGILEFGRGIDTTTFVDDTGCKFPLTETGRDQVKGEVWLGDRDLLEDDLFIGHGRIGSPELVSRVRIFCPPNGFALCICPNSLAKHIVETFKREGEGGSPKAGMIVVHILHKSEGRKAMNVETDRNIPID